MRPLSGGLDQTLTSQGILFRVTSANLGPISDSSIVRSGLSIDNTPIEAHWRFKLDRGVE
jgi:hypothetical protein